MPHPACRRSAATSRAGSQQASKHGLPNSAALDGLPTVAAALPPHYATSSSSSTSSSSLEGTDSSDSEGGRDEERMSRQSSSMFAGTDSDVGLAGRPPLAAVKTTYKLRVGVLEGTTFLNEARGCSCATVQ